MDANNAANMSLSTLIFTKGVLNNKLKRLPQGTAEFTQCAKELRDIDGKIVSLRAAL